MHPGSVQGFGQLGREGVPVFLLPANPVSALVVFEVMVRPLIRMSLGKRQPLRRVVQARTLSPISSVAGRKGYLRGQLMRDQDTGEYLVQALGGAPGASSHLLATLAEANCLVTVPSEAEQVRTGEIVDVAFLAQRGERVWLTDGARRRELPALHVHPSGMAETGGTAAGARRSGAAAPGAVARRRAVEPPAAGRPGAPRTVGAGR